MDKGFLWSRLRILLVWLCVMGILYVAAQQFLKPKPIVITASGELVIQRARDGHFRAPGSVNGRPVEFMVDTGASLVVVSEAFARQAGLAPGEPTTFSTANGNMPGFIVRNVAVSVGPVQVSGIRIGVGLLGLEPDEALLGQNFLSRFDVLLSKDQMILRKR
jgi:aspartyl protease family protein